jgi:hypothetical protein
MSADERYIIVLEALDDPTPAEARLKRFLKMALRAYRLRCVDLKDAPEDVTVKENANQSERIPK